MGDPTAASEVAGREAITRVAPVLVELLEDMKTAPLPEVRSFD